MDILTPKGQETVAQERRAIELFNKQFPQLKIIETPKDKPVRLDGFIYSTAHGEIVSGFETKCRNMSLDDLRSKYNNEWLITADKITEGVKLCDALGIHFHGLLYLVPDDTLLVVPIWANGADEYSSKITFRETETQKTVNGGTITRLNAFVDVSKATQISFQRAPQEG